MFSGGRFNCLCSDLAVMRSAKLVLVFFVLCNESKLVLATMRIGTYEGSV